MSVCHDYKEFKFQVFISLIAVIANDPRPMIFYFLDDWSEFSDARFGVCLHVPLLASDFESLQFGWQHLQEYEKTSFERNISNFYLFNLFIDF